MNDTYIERSFPFSRYFIKVIIVILIIFLLVWLFKKSTHKKNPNLEKTDSKYIIQEIKKKALKYYNQQRINSLTIQEDKILLENLTSKNEKKFRSCNQKESYIKLKKEKDIYSMTIYILCNKKKKVETMYLEHNNYCKTYLCDAKPKTKNKNQNHSIEDNGIKKDQLDSNTDHNVTTKRKITKPVDTGSITIIDTTNHDYIYQYVKNSDIKYSPWSNWYNGGEVMCNQSSTFCTESSLCLKEEKIVKSSESNLLEKHSKNRVSIQEVGSKIIIGCSKYYYISFNNTLYQTNLDYSSIQNWKYEGRYLYHTLPKDTLYTKYLYVNRKDSNYNSYGAEKYYFDKYTFSGLSLANLNCPYKIYRTVKNYSYHSSPIINDKELMTDGKCYKMIRSRTIKSNSNFIWSSYNNQALLNQGYQYTGRKKTAS